MRSYKVASVESEKRNFCFEWGTRHTFALLGFFGFANVYAMRVNLSVAIVAMASSTDFKWDPEEKGAILGAFFYGYVLTQIPGGILAEKFGGKWLFGLGTLVTAVFTMLTPAAAKSGGKGWFIVVRVIEGLGEGVTFPAMHAMVAQWVPASEKSRLGAWITAGCQAGTVVSLPISSLLADSAFGWESVFYVFGALGCIWFAFWAILIFDSPQCHPRITEGEKEFILSQNGHDESHESKKLFPPLKAMMTSKPFWAVILAHVGQNWAFYTLLTETPTYLARVQHFSLKANGLLSALPYAIMWLFSIVSAIMSDKLIERKVISALNARRIFNTISQLGAASGLVWLCFAGQSKTMAIAALCFGVGLNGAIYSGYQFNHVDLSPRYAGTLMGVTNTFANVCGFMAPYVVGAITRDDNEASITAWRQVFLISASVSVSLNAVFVALVSTKVQPWNDE